MSLWDEFLLTPSHHSRFIQTFKYCSFTSSLSIFLQLKNNENSEEVRDSGASVLWTFGVPAIGLVKCRDVYLCGKHSFPRNGIKF